MRIDVKWIETGTKGRIAVMPRPRAGDWLADELSALKASGVDRVVSLLTDGEASELDLDGEAAACEAAGLTFLRFPIVDRAIPEPSAGAGAFVAGLREAVLAGESVVVHCRMGIGRSALIAGAVLRLLGVDGDAALARISEARGLEVPDTDEQRDWVRTFTV